MHFIGIAIIIASLLLSVFYYTNSFIRIKESFIDIFTSLRYYFYTLFNNTENLEVTVVNVSSIPAEDVFPLTWEEFKLVVVRFVQAFFDGANFKIWALSLSDKLLIFSLIFAIFILIFISIKILINNLIQSQNNNYNEDTKALKNFKKIEPFFSKIKRWFISLFAFIFNSKYKIILLLIWLYNLNVYSLIIEFFAYIFYFIASFDLSNIFVQIYKLIVDLTIMLSGLPWFLWLIIFSFIIVKRRTKKGYVNLEHMNAKNCGFVKSLGVATLITGPMNYGKTKLCVSMSLLRSDIFKEISKETIFKADFKFKDFPFINFENRLKKLILQHKIYNLATAELYIKGLKRLFVCYCNERWRGKYKYLNNKNILFGYDFDHYPMTYNNGMYVEDLFSVLDTYAKAYFIYSLDCSDIISNFAVREDNVLESLDNFPLWDNDYFKRNPYDIEDISKYSKILDFDMLRKGKKVVPMNELADTLEFGIVTITELDKERGNSLDTMELKKLVKEANQKNDLFNYSPKMGRHPSTVDFNPYIWFCFDLQRSMKVDADIREVCSEVLEILGSNNNDLALPFFFIEEFLYGLIMPKFKNTYELYRFYHGNNTLYMYLLRKLLVPFHNYYQRIYNIFGYDTTFLKVMNGKLEDAGDEQKYFILRKKDFANRYSTDSHVDFYRQASLRKNKGIRDYKSYSSSRATLNELRSQNSYFIRDLDNITNDNKE